MKQGLTEQAFADIKRLLGDRVLVEPIQDELINEWGLYIDIDSHAIQQKCYVVAVGNGRDYKGRIQKAEFHVGDYVLVKSHEGVPFEYKGKECRIYLFSDVIGRFEET